MDIKGIGRRATGLAIAIGALALGLVSPGLAEAADPFTAPASYWLTPQAMNSSDSFFMNSSYATESTVATDSAGDTTVVDVEPQQTSNGQSQDVLESRTETSDGRWGQIQQIATAPYSSIANVRLGSSSSGALTVAYSVSDGNYPASYTLYTADRPVGGSWQTPAAVSDQFGAPADGSFALAVNSEGDAVLAWVLSKAASNGHAPNPVEAVTRSQSGSWGNSQYFDEVGSVPCPAQYPTCYASNGVINGASDPQVAIDPNDSKATVAWSRWDAVGNSCCKVLYGASFDGTSWTSSRITDYGGGYANEYNGSGKDQDPTLMSITETGGTPTMLLQTGDGSGNPVVVARQGIDQVPPGSGVDGTALQTLSPGDGFGTGRIVSDASGDLAAIWATTPYTGAQTLSGALGTMSGGWGTTDSDIAQGSYSDEGLVGTYGLAMGPGGEAIASWTIATVPPGFWPIEPVGFASAGPAGVWSNAQLIDTDPAGQPDVRASYVTGVAMDGSDRPNVLYVQPRYGGVGSPTLIRKASQRAPQVTISSSEPLVARPGETVSFTAAGSDPANRDLTYHWDFEGDGSYGDATGTTVTHTFQTAGTYKVEAIATTFDRDSGYATFSQSVAANQPPTADITDQFGSPIDGNMFQSGTSVTYDSGAADDRGTGGQVYSGGAQSNACDTECTYQWTFDGVPDSGSGGTQSSDPHTFADDGPHTVSVLVTDSEGASTTATAQITTYHQGAERSGVSCYPQTYYTPAGTIPRTGLDISCSDSTGGTPTVHILQQPVHGTLSVSDDGTLTYTPDGTPGDFTAWYEDTDGSAYSFPEQITLHVLDKQTLASPSLTLSAPSADTPGQTIAPFSLSASLSGGSAPTGSINFKVFGPQPSAPSDCSSGGTSLGSATVPGTGSYNPSNGFTPSQTGDYWWYASYGGDSSNNSADSGCGTQMAETVVGNASPSLGWMSAPATGKAGTTIDANSVSAALSGGSSATGTITFKVFGPQGSAPTDCSAGGTAVGTATVSGDGLYSPSDGFTPAQAGDYWWYATYAGDSNNDPTDAGCDAWMPETVVSGGSAPSLSQLRISPQTFVLAGRLVNGNCVAPTARNSKRPPCTRPIRMSLSYVLNMAATVHITIARLLPGRLVGGHCAAPSRRNRTQPSCTRVQDISGALTAAGKQGFNNFTFRGQIGGQTLGQGNYQMTATPSTHGEAGKPQTVTFSISA